MNLAFFSDCMRNLSTLRDMVSSLPDLKWSRHILGHTQSLPIALKDIRFLTVTGIKFVET